MRKLGLIGHPVEHSLSPIMHNAVFKELSLDCSYNLYDTLDNDLGGRLKELKDAGFVGVNVTIPHKVSVIEYLGKLSEEAELIGAVNTINFKENKGYNTDGIGCVRALMEEDVKLKDSRVLILGAGGAARAISFQLTKEGAVVTLADKISEKAIELVRDISKLNEGTGVIELSDVGDRISEFDLLVNASPVGMHPNVDSSPIDTSLLHKDLSVMDIVYNPVETKLLREAREKGCKTVSGVGMLVHQGAESLKIWLDIEAPTDLMKKVVLEELGK